MRRARIVIAGGGFAALEATLALQALCEDRVELTLISPSARLVDRPAARVAVFDEPDPLVSYDLCQIARDLSVTFVHDAIRAVSAQRHSIRLASGPSLDYDFLVLAVGARPNDALPGALTFRDQRDAATLRRLLDELLLGEPDARAVRRRLVFAIPSRQVWSLPIYELALQSALCVAKRSADLEIEVVSPEDAPLEVFGAAGSRVVADLLRERDIAFTGGAVPHSVRSGRLMVQFNAAIRADRVVSLPELCGPQIEGVPASWSGFIPTDSSGRVEARPDVFAAGDMTTFPVKLGGLATQQADVIAQTIAETIGGPGKRIEPTRILRARLVHGEGALVFRTELDLFGRAVGSTIKHREARRAPELKVFGRYLTPYLSIFRSHAAV